MEDSPRREPWEPHAENAKPRTGRKPIVFRRPVARFVFLSNPRLAPWAALCRNSVAEMPFKFDTHPVSTLDRPREIVTLGAPRPPNLRGKQFLTSLVLKMLLFNQRTRSL